jgi:hypothetical protein
VPTGQNAPFDYSLPTINGLLFCFLSDDRALSYFKKRLFGTLNDETRVFYFLDLSDHAAVRNDFIVYFQFGDHFLKLLTLLFLRKNNEEIEYPENENEREERPDQAAAAAVLKE